MKSIIYTVVVFFLLSMTVSAQLTRNYHEGSVWNVSFIKTKSNMTEEYLNSLKNTWKAVNEQAIKEGYVLSYKILESAAANPSDWDVMLMVEFKNLASMEANDTKMEAMVSKMMGGDEGMKTTNQSRVNIREIYGNKLMREVIY